jgi:phenylpyruvate tautomerase PptA (4-oxalocrotonate tautomerase family)
LSNEYICTTLLEETTMPFVKLHVSSGRLFSRRKLVRDVRLALVETMGIPADHGHVVLYESPSHFRSTHESRSAYFVFVEILMFAGRSDEIKGRLFRRLNDVIHDRTRVPERDILFVVTEADRSNWAARGGVPIPQLDIGY